MSSRSNRVTCLCAFWIFVFVFPLAVFASSTRDIFTNAAETRRPAEGREFEIALGLGGCAGSLIAPNIGLSAAHCRKSGGIKSGIALRDGKPNDAAIVRTLEIGSVMQFDYWIFEIRWNEGEMPNGMRLVPAIQTLQDELFIGENAGADEIYTLGFPVDVSGGKLMHAWGYGKRFNATELINNISLINGNSGGAILRSSDDMLVSVVSGGPHAYGQSGWKGNDWNDSKHWNWGPAMWRVYQKSQILQSIFPNGRNRYLN